MNPNRDFPKVHKYITPDSIIVKLCARDTVIYKNRIIFPKNLQYVYDNGDHWQFPDEFFYNDLTGDCEDQSFFTQSVLLAKKIPCISVWRDTHMWNEIFYNGTLYERFDGNILREKSSNPTVMTKKCRTIRNIFKKKWVWVEYEADWYTKIF